MDTSSIISIISSVLMALFSFLLARMQVKLAKRDKKEDERDEARKKNEVLLVKGVNAAIALGEATATALKSGHCNGETDAALQYARKVKQEQKDFLIENGIDHLY